MKIVGPSPEDKAVLRTVQDKVIAAVLVPEGYFHTFLPQVRGFDVGSLRISFDDGSIAEFGSDILKPVGHPWCEVPVLSVEMNPCAKTRATSFGADPDRWRISEVFTPFLRERRLGTSAELEWEITQWFAEQDMVAAPRGVEFMIGGLPVWLLVSGDGVMVGSLVITCPAFARHNDRPTGQTQWLSQKWRGR